jgi:hypothetical protein
MTVDLVGLASTPPCAGPVLRDARAWFFWFQSIPKKHQHQPPNKCRTVAQYTWQPVGLLVHLKPILKPDRLRLCGPNGTGTKSTLQ